MEWERGGVKGGEGSRKKRDARKRGSSLGTFRGTGSLRVKTKGERMGVKERFEMPTELSDGDKEDVERDNGVKIEKEKIKDEEKETEKEKGKDIEKEKDRIRRETLLSAKTFSHNIRPIQSLTPPPSAQPSSPLTHLTPPPFRAGIKESPWAGEKSGSSTLFYLHLPFSPLFFYSL